MWEFAGRAVGTVLQKMVPFTLSAEEQEQTMSNTLVVNLFGGPGAGKSTTRALTFGKLKMAGVNCEEAPEFAKELVWEGRHKALAYQQYIMGKQAWRIERLIGEVDVVVTDSPILFGLVYGRDYSKTWEDYIVEVHDSWNTLNFHLQRDVIAHPYNPSGRTQTLAQAQEVDSQIEVMLRNLWVPHNTLVGSPEDSAQKIVDCVLAELDA